MDWPAPKSARKISRQNTFKMREFIILAIILFFSQPAKADYGYMSLSALVCEADYAAIGTIVKFDRSYFYLKVDRYLFNSLETDTLQIQKFEDWNCGKRYETYEIGQKELVFFRKSNYVIEEYDLLGYGGGGEFELPIRTDSIFYNYAYGKLKSFPLNDFLTALSDFSSLKQSLKALSKTLSKEEQSDFSKKSALHKIFIECKTGEYVKKIEVSSKGYITNLEKNYLYQDYENKIYVFNFDIDSIILSVEDSEISKRDNYFIVKPKDAWTRRWLNVYSVDDKEKSKLLYNQIFEVLELPEPRIYFGSYYIDKIYGGNDAIPRVAHFLDDMHIDEVLKYELLSYTLTIKSDNSIEEFKVKSSRGTLELYSRLRQIKSGDEISISNVYVLYPNQMVNKITGRTITVSKRG
jgi:hypothetical protein